MLMTKIDKRYRINRSNLDVYVRTGEKNTRRFTINHIWLKAYLFFPSIVTSCWNWEPFYVSKSRISVYQASDYSTAINITSKGHDYNMIYLRYHITSWQSMNI